MSLTIEHLTYTYMRNTPFEKEALHDVSLTIQDGEFVGIIGHTGCGKSTLIQHFNGLLKPDPGRILIDGEVMNHANLKEMRKKVGLVFQYPEYQLFEETVFKDIAFGLKKENLTPEALQARVEEAAEIVGLTPELLEKSIYDLSGGQKRRVAIAGVIVMKPSILVLDEPAAGLDPAGRDEILRFARNLRDVHGITVVLVSHSMEDIARMADRVIVMNEGRVEMTGTPAEVFQHYERLHEIGLSVPQMTVLFHRLKEYFPHIRDDIYTVDCAAEELTRLLAGGMQS